MVVTRILECDCPIGHEHSEDAAACIECRGRGRIDDDAECIWWSGEGFGEDTLPLAALEKVPEKQAKADRVCEVCGATGPGVGEDWCNYCDKPERPVDEGPEGLMKRKQGTIPPAEVGGPQEAKTEEGAVTLKLGRVKQEDLVHGEWYLFVKDSQQLEE